MVDITMSTYGFLLKGGVLVWPILFCSVLGLGIFLERLYFIWRISNADRTFLKQLGTNSSRHAFERHLSQIEDSNGPVANMFLDAMCIEGTDIRAVETVLDHHVDIQVGLASRYLDLMATLAAVSPLLGLLGTVTGLIKAFMVIEAAGGQVNASSLAGGIWEAMLTTALGLGVAIILIVGHRFLLSRIKSIEEQLQEAAFLFLKAMWQRDQRSEEA